MKNQILGNAQTSVPININYSLNALWIALDESLMLKTDEPVEQAEDVDVMVRVSERGVTLKIEPE